MATCSFCGGNVIFVNPIGDDDAIRNDDLFAPDPDEEPEDKEEDEAEREGTKK